MPTLISSKIKISACLSLKNISRKKGNHFLKKKLECLNITFEILTFLSFKQSREYFKYISLKLHSILFRKANHMMTSCRDEDSNVFLFQNIIEETVVHGLR